MTEELAVPGLLVALFSAAAAALAACAAWRSATAAESVLALERDRERNRIEHLKRGPEVEHLQALIGCLGRISALATSDWGEDRNKRLEGEVKDLDLHVSVLICLGTRVSGQIEAWAHLKDGSGDSLPRVVHHQLAQLHGIVGARQEAFLKQKVLEHCCPIDGVEKRV